MNRKDRKSTRLNSSHTIISYAVFCLKKKTQHNRGHHTALEGDVWCARAGWTSEHDPVPHTRRTSRRDHRYAMDIYCLFFFFNKRAPPEIYPLSLHDPLPI